MAKVPVDLKARTVLTFAKKCREWDDSVLMALATIVVNPDEKSSDRIAAGKEILNRGHGKAPLNITLNDGKDSLQSFFGSMLEAIGSAEGMDDGLKIIDHDATPREPQLPPRQPNAAGLIKPD